MSSLGAEILRTPSSLSSSRRSHIGSGEEVELELDRLAPPTWSPKGKGKAIFDDRTKSDLRSSLLVDPSAFSTMATCGICYGDFQSVQNPIAQSLAPSGSAESATYGTTLRCWNQHTYCLPCLTSYIRIKLERENGGPVFPVRCPECPRAEEYELDDDLAARLLDSDLLERWFFQRLVASTEVVSGMSASCLSRTE